MVVTVASIITLGAYRDIAPSPLYTNGANDEQPRKASSPMLLTDEEIAIAVNDEQFSKARSPMLLTDEGISIAVNDEQPRTAASPMLVTVAGILIATSIIISTTSKA